MAYSKQTAQRVRDFLDSQNIPFEEKKMFMGICWMVNDKMLCGTHNDKQNGESLMLFRISDEACQQAIEQKKASYMEMGDRKMKNYILVSPKGYQNDAELAYWLRLCLAYNPLAKSSKKK